MAVREIYIELTYLPIIPAFDITLYSGDPKQSDTVDYKLGLGLIRNNGDIILFESIIGNMKDLPGLLHFLRMIGQVAFADHV